MVKILLRVLFFVLLSVTASAQHSTWFVANTDVTSGSSISGLQINFMSFTSHDTGFFAGVGSTPGFLNTSDSGQDILSQKLPNKVAVSGNSILDMSWPTNTVGYITTANGLVKSADAGKTWSLIWTDSILRLSNISFTSATIGYATGQRGDSDTKFFVAKTTDGGVSWKNVFPTTFQTNTGRIYFKDDMHGIFFAQDISRQEWHVGYTTDGMATAKITGTLKNFGSLPWFLSWTDDGAWNAGYQGVQRSTDNGTTWAYTWDKSKDTLGDALTGCFGGKHAFVFTDLAAHVLESTDYGVTYVQYALPDSIGPVASAITSRSAYVVGVDFSGHDVLLRADLPVKQSTGGGVSWAAQSSTPFTASVEGQVITFTSLASTTARTIEVMDVLGRSSYSLPLASNFEMARMSRTALRPGTYFARLGNACVKFTITN